MCFQPTTGHRNYEHFWQINRYFFVYTGYVKVWKKNRKFFFVVFFLTNFLPYALTNSLLIYPTIQNGKKGLSLLKPFLMHTLDTILLFFLAVWSSAFSFDIYLVLISLMEFLPTHTVNAALQLWVFILKDTCDCTGSAVHIVLPAHRPGSQRESGVWY